MALDRRGGWFPTPTTLLGKSGPHAIKVKALLGYKDLDVPASLADADLKIEVNLDRPVFEAGIGLAVAAAVLVAGSFVEMALIQDSFDAKTSIWASQLAVGCAAGLAGGLMVGLDKQHQPEIKVFAGNKPVAAPAL